MSEGDFLTVIDSLEFDTVNGRFISIIHVDGDIYAIAYRGVDNDGFIKTFDIDSSGNIGAAVIDSLEFDTSFCTETDIVHIFGDIYAVVYSGPGGDGFIVTLSIDSSGNIGAAVIDSLEYDTLSGGAPSIKHVFGDIYAIAFVGWLSVGKVVTVDIDNSGNIGAAVIDSLEFEGTFCRTPCLLHVSSDVYAVAHEGPDNDGWIKTFDIDSAGNIGAAVIDSLEFDTVNCFFPTLLLVSGNVYAVSYTGPDGDGWVKTFTIDALGNIGASVIDSLEFDTDNGYSPVMIHVSGGVYAVSYRGSLGDGFTVTFTIDSLGNIGAAVIDSLEFDTLNCNEPDMIHVYGDVYAIAYQGVDDDGFIKTIGIETFWPGSRQFLPVMGVG